MIVQVRGASGSGKSTLVRAWVDEHGPPLRYMMKSAAAMGLGHVDCPPSRPYALALPVPDRPRVIVPGHYDASGGGADMIKSKAHIYDIVDQAVRWKHNVLMESLFISKDVTLTLERYGPQGIHVLFLDLPEEECRASVHARRAALGREYRELRQHARDWKDVGVACRKLEEAGVTVERLDREGCARRVRELLG